jgi:hypothetical protein
MGLDRILVWVIGILAALSIIVASVLFLLAPVRGGSPVVMSAAEGGCLASGGTVGEGLCCASVEDFPNTCLVGACACSADFSHAVKTCSCPAGMCFNGTACTKVIGSFEACVAAGYPVMESYPRQCSVPGGPTFTEKIPTVITAQSCGTAGGHWTDCGSRCRLDNAGKPDVLCPDLCEGLCECGGIAGFQCPTGFTCRLPSGIADALGYCVAGG